MDNVSEPSKRLLRVLTTPLLTLYGLGVTVGAGIYVLIGETTAEAGIYAPASFLVAAIVVAFTAFSYAELSSKYPISAGEAAYVEAGFKSRNLTIAVGLAVALSGVVSASVVAIGAASYLHQLFTDMPQQLLTAFIVITMGIVAFWGIKQSVIVAAVVTIIEIGGLIMVIYWGSFVAEASGVNLEQMVPPLIGGHWFGIGTASLLAFYAFVGFEDMANVAEEVKNPVKTMPRAIMLTLILATLLYLGTAVATITSVPLNLLSSSEAPLMLVFQGASLTTQKVFSVVAIFATINGVLIQIIMASRVLYGLADRDHLPKIFSWVSTRTKTPLVSIIFVVSVIVVLSTTMPIGRLAQYTSQIVLIVFILVNCALVRLKFKNAQKGDFFEVPVIVPILGIITCMLLFVTGFF